MSEREGVERKRQESKEGRKEGREAIDNDYSWPSSISLTHNKRNLETYLLLSSIGLKYDTTLCPQIIGDGN